MIHRPSKTLESDERHTPQAFFDELNAEFGFTLDVAADTANAKCERFYTQAENGLAQKWDGVVWCNPPYSDVKPWVVKALEESQRGVTSVLLLPASTCTGWFHDYVLPHAELRWVRGKLTFGPFKSRAPFASLVCIFRGR